MKLIWLASRGRIDGSGRYENSVEVEATDTTSTAYALYAFLLPSYISSSVALFETKSDITSSLSRKNEES
eukprot:scaffold753_cov199-Alexandrium_tamarense.AAC.16